uniref:Uncharacterized protein n=1 Tax=Lutzomyia longipalpis TaxID=7200 RepID=A0A7G3B790_LUTLO
MTRFKWKFLFINIVFYICWLPNLIGGFILWTVWGSVPENVMIVIWYAMAATNPLQAFLNAFVYRRWAKSYAESVANNETRRETSPLLEKHRSWLRRPGEGPPEGPSLRLNNPSSHRTNCSCF